MAKLAFRNHDQGKITAAVEEMLRQETGAAAPISYSIEDSRNIDAGTVMGEVLHAMLGGKRAAIQLFTVHFTLTQPRPADLWVQIDKQGIGAYAGPLLYVIGLSKRIESEVGLEPDKGATFGGDPSDTAKLNADLAKRVHKLLRGRMQVGGFTISTRPFFKIMPKGQTSTLLVNTLPRFTSLGFSSTLDAKEVFEIASVVEAAL